MLSNTVKFPECPATVPSTADQASPLHVSLWNWGRFIPSAQQQPSRWRWKIVSQLSFQGQGLAVLTSWDLWKAITIGKTGKGHRLFEKFLTPFRSSEGQLLVKEGLSRHNNAPCISFSSTDHRGWAFWEGCLAAWPQYRGCRLCTLWQCNPGGSFHWARSGSLHAGPGRHWIQHHLFLRAPWASKFEFLFHGIISQSFWVHVFGVRELYHE